MLADRRYCYPLTITDHYSRKLLACRAMPAIGTDDVMHAFRALFRAVGCEQCDYQGYRGRVSILEILKMDPAIDELIARRATGREIRTAASAKARESLTKAVELAPDQLVALPVVAAPESGIATVGSHTASATASARSGERPSSFRSSFFGVTFRRPLM